MCNPPFHASMDEATKQGSIYVLDRATGQPVVPIHEIAVPQGAVAGDRTSPTQPKSDLNFMPPPLKERDMWGVTPFDQLLCRFDFKSMRYDGQLAYRVDGDAAPVEHAEVAWVNDRTLQ